MSFLLHSLVVMLGLRVLDGSLAIVATTYHQPWCSPLALSLSFPLWGGARVSGGEGSTSEMRVWGFGVWES